MSKENLYAYLEPERKNCIRTFCGIYFDVFNPKTEDILIEDIAHALSMQCRFGGHVRKFYSVAQHSIHVSDFVPIEYRLAALLHDATEAYLIDVPRPIKQSLTNYKEIEANLASHIAKKFGFDYPFIQVIHEADEKALQSEWDRWMVGKIKPASNPMSQSKAEQAFLYEFQIIKSISK